MYTSQDDPGDGKVMLCRPTWEYMDMSRRLWTTLKRLHFLPTFILKFCSVLTRPSRSNFTVSLFISISDLFLLVLISNQVGQLYCFIVFSFVAFISVLIVLNDQNWWELHYLYATTNGGEGSPLCTTTP